MNIFLRIPLFVLVLAVYNVIALTRPDLLQPDSAPLFSLNLVSGAIWQPIFNDAILLFGVVMIYFELFKATRTHVSSIVEHVFSLLVFIIFLVEFIVWEPCGTSTFLILTLLSMLDVVGGFTITISTARRDFGVPGSGHS